MPSISRRTFLKMFGLSAAAWTLPQLPQLSSPQMRPHTDLPPNGFLVSEFEGTLRRTFSDVNMTLDFRMIDLTVQEHFAVQINAEKLMPTASCFKAFVALYYFVHTPQDAWDAGEGSALYSTIVFSNNVQTGRVLVDVAARIEGFGNALQKFNDFLIYTLGMQQGLHTWGYPNSATVGLRDPRFAPSETRQVDVRGILSRVDNVTTAADLVRGWRCILTSTPADVYTDYPQFPAACSATRDLLSIRADDYQAPVERVYPEGGYTGKDGILPSDTLPDVGRVVNDAGIIYSPHGAYLLGFLSAGESEVVAIDVLRLVVEQIGVYETFLEEQGG